MVSVCLEPRLSQHHGQRLRFHPASRANKVAHFVASANTRFRSRQSKRGWSVAAFWVDKESFTGGTEMQTKVKRSAVQTRIKLSHICRFDSITIIIILIRC